MISAGCRRHSTDMIRGMDGREHLRSGLPGRHRIKTSGKISVEHVIEYFQTARTLHMGEAPQMLQVDGISNNAGFHDAVLRNITL
jgi:hypothetical protein